MTTEREMLDRLNVRYGQTYRNGSYVGRKHSRAEHVPSTLGFRTYGDRIADYIAVENMNGGAIHGHEVKVSRADWLAELRDPSKASAWADYCNTWWIVAPPGVVRGDLPEGWGLLLPHGRTLRVGVHAERRSPLNLPTEMIASLARAITRTEAHLARTEERTKR